MAIEQRGGVVQDVFALMTWRRVECQRGSREGGYELVAQAAWKVNRNAGSQRAEPCGAA
jgi:hypothetical protein